MIGAVGKVVEDVEGIPREEDITQSFVLCPHSTATPHPTLGVLQGPLLFQNSLRSGKGLRIINGDLAFLLEVYFVALSEYYMLW